MEPTEKRAIQSATERAHRTGVHVVSEGMRRDTGEKVWLVSSATDPDRLHIVYLVDAQHLGCSCAAYHWHPETPCTHRAAVHERLLEEHAVRRSATKRESNPATAPLRRSNQPFSMMK